MSSFNNLDTGYTLGSSFHMIGHWHVHKEECAFIYLDNKNMWIFENKKMWLYVFNTRICGHAFWPWFLMESVCHLLPSLFQTISMLQGQQKLRPATTPFAKARPRTCRNMYGRVACVLGRFTAAKLREVLRENSGENSRRKRKPVVPAQMRRMLLEDLPTKLVHLYAFIWPWVKTL